MTKRQRAARSGSSPWLYALIANYLIVILGVVLTLCCFISFFTVKKYMIAVDNYSGEVLMIMSIIGVTTWMVGALGARISSSSRQPGAEEKLRYIIYAYVGWGVGLTVLLFASAVFVYLRKDDVEDDLAPGFNISSYTGDAAVHKAIDSIQEDLKCCGNLNHTEWFQLSVAGSIAVADEVTIPQSCCRETECVTVAATDEAQALTPYRAGCLTRLSTYYSSILVNRAVIMGVIAAVELVVVALFLIRIKGLCGKNLARGDTTQLVYRLDDEIQLIHKRDVKTHRDIPYKSKTHGINVKDDKSKSHGINKKDDSIKTHEIHKKDDKSKTHGINKKDGKSKTSVINKNDDKSEIHGINKKDGKSKSHGIDEKDDKSKTHVINKKDDKTHGIDEKGDKSKTHVINKKDDKTHGVGHEKDDKTLLLKKK